MEITEIKNGEMWWHIEKTRDKWLPALSRSQKARLIDIGKALGLKNIPTERNPCGKCWFNLCNEIRVKVESVPSAYESVKKVDKARKVPQNLKVKNRKK